MHTPKTIKDPPYKLDGYPAINRCTAIPYGIKEIADYACFGASHSEIGVGAFREARCADPMFSATDFWYVYLHETKIQDIPAYAFEGVTSVKGLTLPTELKTIGERTFANLSIRYTYTLTLPAFAEYIGTDESKLVEIAEGAFDGAEIRNKTLSLPNGLKTIGDNAWNRSRIDSRIP